MTSQYRTRSRVATFAFVASSLMTFVGCGGSSEPTTTPKDITPATIAPSSTDTLRGAAGAAASASLTVTVKNKAGDAIDGAVVTFVVTSGGGSVSATNVTSVAGQATTVWTLGPTVGVQTVTATSGSVSTTFTAVASASTAANITKVAGDSQTVLIGALVPVRPSVKVTDRFGNPVAGALVGFVAAGGGGQVTSGASNTDANGIATIGSWQLGAAPGVNTLVASTGSLSVTFTATATVGAAATVTLTPSTVVNALSVGDTVRLAAVARDAGSNVIPNPSVTWRSSNTAVASVGSTGLVTGVGAGIDTITATVGSAVSIGVVISVTGHPAGANLTSIAFTGANPADIAFTRSAMIINVPGLNQLFVVDQTTLTQAGVIQIGVPASTVAAPTKASGPVVFSVGGLSKLYFTDPASTAVTDSVDTGFGNTISSFGVSSTGSKIYALLSDGELVIFDGTSIHSSPTRISIGGGLTSARIAPGDSVMYILTTIGYIARVDLKNPTATPQFITIPSTTDFAIGSSGLFYLLDGTNSLVRVFNAATGATITTNSVAPGATSIAVSPDERQIWLTQGGSTVTKYAGNSTNGFLPAGQLTTSQPNPRHIYFSPTGSFAAITNSGNSVDIVR